MSEPFLSVLNMSLAASYVILFVILVTSLLSLATDRRILNGNPLAFGEGNVKGRIKNVLNYKKLRCCCVQSV